MTDKPKSGLREKAVREFKKFAIIFFYVWIIDGLFTLHKALILETHAMSGQVFALVNAFVLAKIILVLEMFKVGEILQRHPPIFRIVFKATLFGLLLLAFSVLEEAIKGWFHGKTFDESISEIGGGSLEGMLIMAVIMAVALVPYLVCSEVGRVIGSEKLIFLIFQSPAAVADRRAQS